MPKVVNITERHQAVVAAREYEAFGQVVSQTGDWSDSDFGFHPNWLQLKGVAGGRYYIAPGGRVYDTRVGRYLQRDPAAAAGEHPYVALANNPNKYVDPSGFTQEYTNPQVGGFERLLSDRQRQLKTLQEKEAVAKKKGIPIFGGLTQDIQAKEADVAQLKTLIEQAKERQRKWNGRGPFRTPLGGGRLGR